VCLSLVYKRCALKRDTVKRLDRGSHAVAGSERRAGFSAKGCDEAAALALVLA
jgi:hypothetical protein